MSVIGGVTVSRNRAIKIDTYLLTYLPIYLLYVPVPGSPGFAHAYIRSPIR